MTADSGIEGRVEETERLMPVKDTVIISSDNKLVPPLSMPPRDFIEEVRGWLGVRSNRGRDEFSAASADGRVFKSRIGSYMLIYGRLKPNPRCMHMCIMT